MWWGWLGACYWALRVFGDGAVFFFRNLSSWTHKESLGINMPFCTGILPFRQECLRGLHFQNKGLKPQGKLVAWVCVRVASGGWKKVVLNVLPRGNSEKGFAGLVGPMWKTYFYLKEIKCHVLGNCHLGLGSWLCFVVSDNIADFEYKVHNYYASRRRWGLLLWMWNWIRRCGT